MTYHSRNRTSFGEKNNSINSSKSILSTNSPTKKDVSPEALISTFLSICLTITSMCLSLIITNKEIINNNFLKIIIYTYGIAIIIISEILLDLSSRELYGSLFLYFTLFLFF